MQYMRSVQFIMDRKSWMSNILMGGLCLLIPVVGPIVFSGYLFIVIESLKRDPDHVDYPDFDFNQFSKYLMRGIWPFLMRLVLGMIIGVPLGFVMAVFLVMGGVIAGSTKTPAIFFVFYIFAIVFAVVLSIASVFLTLPAELQAGLGREFHFGRMWTFVKEFNKRVWKEILLSVLFLFGIGIAAEIVGLLLFCVGIYFTMAAVVMAQHHLMFQMYMLYLERGGAPIIPAQPDSERPEPPDDDLRYDDNRGAADDRGRPAPDEPDDRFRAER